MVTDILKLLERHLLTTTQNTCITVFIHSYVSNSFDYLCICGLKMSANVGVLTKTPNLLKSLRNALPNITFQEITLPGKLTSLF